MISSVIPARLQFNCGHAALVSLPRLKGESPSQRSERITREKADARGRACDFCGPREPAPLEVRPAQSVPSVELNGHHATAQKETGTPGAETPSLTRLGAEEARRTFPPRRRLTDEQEREVTRLYAETTTPVPEISQQFSIGESSVYRIAQRHGAGLRGRTTPAPSTRPARARKQAAAPVVPAAAVVSPPVVVPAPVAPAAVSVAPATASVAPAAAPIVSAAAPVAEPAAPVALAAEPVGTAAARAVRVVTTARPRMRAVAVQPVPVGERSAPVVTRRMALRAVVAPAARPTPPVRQRTPRAAPVARVSPVPRRALQRFQIQFRVETVLQAADIRAALRQVESLGATEILAIVRQDR